MFSFGSFEHGANAKSAVHNGNIAALNFIAIAVLSTANASTPMLSINCQCNQCNGK